MSHCCRARVRSIFFLFSLAMTLGARAQIHAVAVTFDDLPDLDADDHTTGQMRTLMRKLTTTLALEKVPVTGFVNEDKLLGVGETPDEGRVALIQHWLDVGLDIGNHTFSHADLSKVPVADFESDILKGERLTRPLVAASGRRMTWFRHPYLDTGNTVEERDAVNTFLHEHGYRIAPVTIDDSEWIFDVAYDKAGAAGRADVQKRIGRAYLQYMQRRIEWAEWESGLVFGRDIPQVLLLHDSVLNADFSPALLRLIRHDGYRFITLEEALLDPAYDSPDSWTDGGVGWIERWGTSAGIPEDKFSGDPPVPSWIAEYAGIADQ